MYDFEIGPIHRNELVLTSDLIKSVISPLQYYSEAAKYAECAKYTPEGLDELVAGDHYSVLVARTTSNLIGFCISRYDDGVIWLAWFGVETKHRRGGVGSALLQQLEVTARARNCTKIWCDTRTENTGSQRVLERAGYSRLCTLKDHWYGHDYHLWEKCV